MVCSHHTAHCSTACLPFYDTVLAHACRCVRVCRGHHQVHLVNDVLGLAAAQPAGCPSKGMPHRVRLLCNSTCLCVMLQARPVWQQIVDYCENNGWSAAIGAHVAALHRQIDAQQQQLAEAQHTISRQGHQLMEQSDLHRQIEEQAAELAVLRAQLQRQQ